MPSQNFLSSQSGKLNSTSTTTLCSKRLTEKESSLRTLPRLNSITVKPSTLTRWASTNSQPWLPNNSLPLISVWLCQKALKLKSNKLITSEVLRLTGPLKELSLTWRTKEIVDHAGHSQPPVHWKDLARCHTDHCKTSQNNNWLIVQDHTEIKDATVV